jgi:hypothetical protein
MSQHGISAGIVRNGLMEITRKEVTPTLRMNFVIIVFRCIVMKDANGPI